MAIVASLLAAGSAMAGTDVLATVDAFVTLVASADIRDLVIDQTLDVYDPQGRHRQSRTDQRLFVKVPDRQRLEQAADGGREVQIVAGNRAWSRGVNGKIEETSLERQRAAARLLLPFRRSSAELLAEWRSLGVRDSVSHGVQTKGRRVMVIGAGAGDRQSAAVWLDEQYGVVRLVTREKLPRGPALVDLTFSEHRPLLGGLFFPYRHEAFVDGRLALLIIVRSVVANTGLSDDLFDPDVLRRGR